MFKTFVINLDKDTKRMEFMKHQLDTLGITFERHSAIDGRKHTLQPGEYNEAMAIKEGGHALRLGELGCAISHAQVVSYIVKNKVPYTLVLEDDVRLPDEFKYIVDTTKILKHFCE